MYRFALLLAILAFQGSGSQTSGVIRGRIVNADGTPADHVRVSALSEEPLEKAFLLSDIVETDDSGNYRLDGVRPGRYFVLAGRLEAPTFFPGTLEQQHAQSVTVAAGKIAAGIDFQVAQISVGFTVSGRVIGLDALDGAEHPATVTLVPASDSRRLTTTVTTDGTFEFTRVLPGVYQAALTSTIPGAKSFPAPFNLTARNVANIEILLRREKDVVGRVVVEGNAAIPRFKIGHKTPSFLYSNNVDPRANGTFRITVLEGEQRLSLDLPKGYRVKSSTYGSANLMTGAVNIAIDDPFEVRIVLSPPEGFRVRGRVVGLKKVEPLEAPLRATVRSYEFANDLVAPVEKDGSFEFSNVMPGNYEIRLEGLNAPYVLREPLKVTGKNVNSFEITIPDRVEIQGRVTVQGSAPVPRFKVRLTSGRALTRDELLKMVADHLAENDLIGDSVERLTSTTEINIRPNPDGTFKASLFEGEWNVLVPPEFNLPPFGSFGLGRPVVNSSLKVTRKEHAELKIFVQAPNGKPVKVRGRLDGLDGLSFVPGTATVSLTASRYAEVWNAAVRNDGTFEFPSVFPGLYALRLNAPGVSADVCIPVTAKEGGTNDIVFPVPVPEATPDKLQIISAIFGAATGSADVTPIVRKLVRPGSHELYAASSWLEADPAAGTDRLSLSLSYLYQCADHSFTTGEAGAVSYAMLAEHADPSRRARLTGRADFQILHAQYGNRRDFTDVTARIRELMGPDAPPFVVSDPIINGGPHTTNSRFLSITYLYEGRRATFTTRTGQEVRYEQLVENAKHPDDDRIGVVPEWLAIARP